MNGESGYKWQPNDSPSIREPLAPTLQESDVLIYDEPGRCGGLDHHSHHFRMVKNSSSFYLLVRHGGGEERIRLFPHSKLAEMLSTLDSNARYWILATIYSAHSDSARSAREDESMKWKQAAADKRIKTRKQPARGIVKVWIESKIA